VRVLSKALVEELLDPDELIDAVAVAMADLSAGRASVPSRIAAVLDGSGLLAAMPGYSPSLGVLAAKLLTVFPGNPAAGHPVHQAMIVAFDPITGRPTALMDGDAITALRTAAASALSVRLLARPDAEVLAVIGTGPQASAHALLVSRVRAFREIRVAGRDPGRTAAVVDALAARGLATRPCGIAEALDGADVICAATSCIEPILGADRVAEGAHIASVGFIPNGREIDPALYADALLVVEHRATAFAPFPVGSNDIRELLDAGTVRGEDVVELGELVDGARPARRDPRQRTIYKSVGLAAQDVAGAAVVLRAAERAGAGTELTL
jgi:alanine dehydrogenase